MKKVIIVFLLIIPFIGLSQGNFFYGQHGNLSAEVDTATYINIRFDGSGSLGSTYDSLTNMVNLYLKDSLISYYNNDEDIYNRKVIVGSNSNEQTFSKQFLENNIGVLAENEKNKIVTLVYQDEANSIYYTNPFDSTNVLTDSLVANITSLRSATSTYINTLRYTGVIFQIDNPSFNPDDDFKRFIKSIENGYGNYSGSNGLSDRSGQFVYYYDQTKEGTAVYYTNQLLAALRDLGFDL